MNRKFTLAVIASLAICFSMIACAPDNTGNSTPPDVTSNTMQLEKSKFVKAETKEIAGEEKMVYYYTGQGYSKIGDNIVSLTATFLCILNETGQLIIHDVDSASNIEVELVSGWESTRAEGTIAGSCNVVDHVTAKLPVKYQAKRTEDSDYALIPEDVTFTCDFSESGINANGQSYGLARDGDFDLTAAIGIDGTSGYVYQSDLDGPQFQSVEETLEWSRENAYRIIPLYARDGKEIIGEFEIGELPEN